MNTSGARRAHGGDGEGEGELMVKLKLISCGDSSSCRHLRNARANESADRRTASNHQSPRHDDADAIKDKR